MFFKIALCVSLFVFSSSLCPSALKRDKSFQFQSTDAEDGFTSIEATQNTLSPASSQAAQESAAPTPSLTGLTTSPSSNTTISTQTPEDNPHELSQVMATMQPSPKSQITTAPKNPTPIPSGENFLINSAAPVMPVSVLQQPPVEPLEPSTPTPSIVLPVVASALLAHEIQTQTNNPNAPIPQHLSQLSQPISSLPSPVLTPLTDQARLSLAVALSTMRPVQEAPAIPAASTDATPIPAQHPMKLSNVHPLPRRKSDLAIQIAPVSPFKKGAEKNDDAPATNCCAPIFCCGKQIFSGNMPACPCPVNGCVIL